MILLIDAGNTRVKWGVVRGTDWLADGALGHDELGALRGIAAARPNLVRVFGANVAGPGIAAVIAKALGGLSPAPEWLVPTAACGGVTNGYTNPAQLGADRWAALIGARAMHAGPALVVTAGTATTVDLLDAAGHFRGGLILPGEALMLRALATNTAQLPYANGRFDDAPRNTADAIVSGCLHAQAGAIERMFRNLAATPDAMCLLGGGGADAIAPLLTIPLQRVDNLVLKGLAAITVGAPASPPLSQT